MFLFFFQSKLPKLAEQFEVALQPASKQLGGALSRLLSSGKLRVLGFPEVRERT